MFDFWDYLFGLQCCKTWERLNLHFPFCAFTFPAHSIAPD